MTKKNKRIIGINNEADLREWFKLNYKDLGFDKILKSNTKKFPDFIVDKKGKKINIELETKASNFILHKHPPKNNTIAVCLIKDCKLKIPIIKIKNLKLNERKTNNFPYSIKNQIFNFFSKEKILTSGDISQKLNINRGTAERHLLELVIDGKIERIKKEKINLWMLK